jgi:hypothetical protein
MAVRYYCDNCGAEAQSGELQVVVISVPPQSETFDVCPACAQQFRGELERCGEAKRDQRALAAPPSKDAARALTRYTALMNAPGVGGLVRVASYAAVFVAFFVLVTVLTSLR